MQATHFDGSFGKIEPFTEEGLKQQLANPNVKHVEVFEGTVENIQARQKKLGVKKRYQKAPKIRNKK
jgi:hypothetical protein